MNANIFRFEFRARLKSVLTWSLALSALFLVFLSIMPSFTKQAELINQLMERFPPELLAAFGMTAVDLSTVTGYYSLLFLFVQVCLAIQAANYGFGLVSIEETELTADFLLSKPVSRAQILTSKLLAALASLTITNAVVWIDTFAGIALFGSGLETKLGPIVLLLLSIVIFQLFFLSIGLVVSLLVKRVRSVTPYALGLGFGMYILAAFSEMEGSYVLEYITAFKHFDASYIVLHGAYDAPLVALNVAVTVIALAASYWLYIRRDIPAVV